MLDFFDLSFSLYGQKSIYIFLYKSKNVDGKVRIRGNLCTGQRMKFSIEDFFSKCDQIHSLLRIWSHLLKKSLMENFIFCAVVFRHILRSEDLNGKRQNDKISKVKIGSRLCVNHDLTICFYPTDTLPNKLKVHKVFILRPGLMYC